jgi:hypothetical protein
MSKRRTTPAELAEEAALLRHRPGSAGHDLATWLAAEKRRDQAKARAKKKAKLVPPVEKEEAELQAQHLLKTSHGTVSALHQLFKSHVLGGQPSQPAKPAAMQVKSGGVDAALESGRRWRESKKFRPQRSSDGYTREEVRRGRLEMYRPGRAETSRGLGHPGRS